MTQFSPTGTARGEFRSSAQIKGTEIAPSGLRKIALRVCEDTATP
jgi:hypothetical protein